METFVPIDSFSQLHSYSYSIIALQELNLNYFYSRVYWNCACLSIEATGVDDDSNVAENGERKKKNASTDYGEVAKAIYKMKRYGINVAPPSINTSDLDFTPNEDTDNILFGIGGISAINIDIANQVIANRPYTSFKDFYRKNCYEGSLVTNTKFIQLIKAGCFDEFNPDRVHIMKQYIALSTPRKTSLKMANIDEILRLGLHLPKTLRQPYTFKKYVCSKQFYYSQHPNFKSKKLYWLDNTAMKFFIKNCQSCMKEGVDYWQEDDKTVVVDKALENLFKDAYANLKEYINTHEFFTEYNKAGMRKKYEESVGESNPNKWSFETISYYSNEHELANLDFERYNINHFSELPKNPVFIDKSWGKRTWKQYSLSAICGTVIDKSDNNHYFTILTPDDEVVNVNMSNGQYASYKSQISIVDDRGNKKIVDKSWISRGTLVIITGYRRQDSFVAKRYSKSVYQHTMMKIEKVYDDGSVDITSERYSPEEN